MAGNDQIKQPEIKLVLFKNRLPSICIVIIKMELFVEIEIIIKLYKQVDKVNKIKETANELNTLSYQKHCYKE